MTMARQLEIIEAPTSLGLRPPSPGQIPGTRFMPQTLVNAGLLQDVPLAAHVRLPEPPYAYEPDDDSGVRNHREMIRFTRRLDEAVTAALRAGRLPVVIGGDCSALLGPAVALKRIGRYSLVHVDAHSDFGHEGNWGRPYPSIAGADLAVVTGRGPGTITNIDGLRPYFRDEDVVQLGEKSDATAADYWFKDFQHTAVQRWSLADVRQNGLATVLPKVEASLAATPTGGFWLHIDLDVLDSALLPAVDSPEAGGLTWEELDLLLDHLLGHPKLAGLNAGIYDPDLDPGRIYARQIAALFRRHLLALAAPLSPACEEKVTP
jgi:arginase